MTFTVNTHICAKGWWIQPMLKLFDAFPVDPTNPMSAGVAVSCVRRTVIFPEGGCVTGAIDEEGVRWPRHGRVSRCADHRAHRRRCSCFFARGRCGCRETFQSEADDPAAAAAALRSKGEMSAQAPLRSPGTCCEIGRMICTSNIDAPVRALLVRAASIATRHRWSRMLSASR